MAEAKRFSPWKLIAGIMCAQEEFMEAAKVMLMEKYGAVDLQSRAFTFDQSPYYEEQFGDEVKRLLVSFENLVNPADLSDIKLATNRMEDEMRKKAGSERRVINLDPGILSASSLIMATAKDFAHRVPLQKGIYAHLELMFGRGDVRPLPWTYPDFKERRYHPFLLETRRRLLSRLRNSTPFT
ncbi:MAG: DUF4416 family protein [Candidatus Aminicenantes bacterium]